MRHEFEPMDCRQSLQYEPIPLYSPDHNLAVFWSAKAGCSFAAKWFFFQINQLEAARACSSWIHDYRARVFYRQEGYYEKLNLLLEPEVKKIKFVRNPWDRVVSAYLAYCEALYQGAKLPPYHRQVISEISTVLNRPLGNDAGFTFREFVRYLSEIGVENCDIHFRRQVGICELSGNIKGLRILRIEDAATLLPSIEADLGLRPSPLDDLVRSPHHTRRTKSTVFCGDQVFQKTLAGAMPVSSSFYDAEIAEQVFYLYRDDFLFYGYPLVS
jgi:hypothetical protein